MAEDKAFRLVKEISPLTVEFDTPESLVWNIIPGDLGYAGSAWEALSGDVFYWNGTLDIAGVTRHEKTLFFASNGFQRPLPYLTSVDLSQPTMPGFTLLDQMIVTDVPLKNPQAQVIPWSQTAGFNETEDDFMCVKLAMGFLLSSNTNTPKALAVADSWSFGSGDPTASDKLYLYRWLHIFKATQAAPVVAFQGGERIGLPGYRYVGTGISTEEPDQVWFMRLKRSFEIQETAVHD